MLTLVAEMFLKLMRSGGGAAFVVEPNLHDATRPKKCAEGEIDEHGLSGAHIGERAEAFALPHPRLRADVEDRGLLVRLLVCADAGDGEFSGFHIQALDAPCASAALITAEVILQTRGTAEPEIDAQSGLTSECRDIGGWELRHLLPFIEVSVQMRADGNVPQLCGRTVIHHRGKGQQRERAWPIPLRSRLLIGAVHAQHTCAVHMIQGDQFTGELLLRSAGRKFTGFELVGGRLLRRGACFRAFALRMLEASHETKK